MDEKLKLLLTQRTFRDKKYSDVLRCCVVSHCFFTLSQDPTASIIYQLMSLFNPKKRGYKTLSIAWDQANFPRSCLLFMLVVQNPVCDTAIQSGDPKRERE